LAIVIGLIAGAVAPAIAKATVGDLIPLPLTRDVETRPLALAAVFGFLVTIAFTMWPLARTRHVPASALFRHHVQTFVGWPGIPDRAPSFFFLDVRNDEKQAFLDLVQKEPGVTKVDTAPMLRGRITNLKGMAIEKVKASPDAAWALRGDRGLTYASDLPKGSTITDGLWWPANYSGPPLVSFVDEVAKGLDLKVGDDITVNVL